MFDGREERAIARGLALEQMLGNLIAAMIENGQLREHQLEAIFDYDVGAEA
jgi:hypothetical protein